MTAQPGRPERAHEERTRPDSGRPDRARLFVALDLPNEARERLLRWRSEALQRLDGLRPVVPDALHITLCFLGWRPMPDIGPIGDACAGAAAGVGPLQLSWGGAVLLPPRRPRVLAVEVEDPTRTLAGLQAALAAALSAGGWYAPEARPFLGHVTVARAKSGARIRDFEVPAAPAIGFEATSVTLYRSRLERSGARYEALRTIELGTEHQGALADPVASVRAFHAVQREVYAGGDLLALRPWLTEDVVWHVPGRSRIAGRHQGIEAVLSYFDNRRRLSDETFRVNVRGLSLIGDRVVQLAGGTATVGGREVSWETVGLFRVERGRIAECWLVPFDLYQFDQIWR